MLDNSEKNLLWFLILKFIFHMSDTNIPISVIMSQQSQDRKSNDEFSSRTASSNIEEYQYTQEEELDNGVGNNTPFSNMNYSNATATTTHNHLSQLLFIPKIMKTCLIEVRQFKCTLQFMLLLGVPCLLIILYILLRLST